MRWFRVSFVAAYLVGILAYLLPATAYAGCCTSGDGYSNCCGPCCVGGPNSCWAGPCS